MYWCHDALQYPSSEGTRHFLLLDNHFFRKEHFIWVLLGISPTISPVAKKPELPQLTAAGIQNSAIDSISFFGVVLATNSQKS